MIKKSKNDKKEALTTKKKPKKHGGKPDNKTRKTAKKQVRSTPLKQGLVHKIWLAGIGAYGKTCDVTADGLGKVSEKGSAMFDDLVKRGEEIEGNLPNWIGENKAVSGIAEQVVKTGNRVVSVTEDAGVAVSRFQRKQLEGFEKHMKRMRDMLMRETGLMKAKKAAKLENQLKRLQRDVMRLRRDILEKDKTVMVRVDDLNAQVETVDKRSGKSERVTRVTDVSSALANPDHAPEPVDKADDLKRIKGIGVVLERKLNAAGICRFSQLVGLTRTQTDQLDTDLKLSGRMIRDGWIAQATALTKTDETRKRAE